MLNNIFEQWADVTLFLCNQTLSILIFELV